MLVLIPPMKVLHVKGIKQLLAVTVPSPILRVWQAEPGPVWEVILKTPLVKEISAEAVRLPPVAEVAVHIRVLLAKTCRATVTLAGAVHIRTVQNVIPTNTGDAVNPISAVVLDAMDNLTRRAIIARLRAILFAWPMLMIPVKMELIKTLPIVRVIFVPREFVQKTGELGAVVQIKPNLPLCAKIDLKYIS